MPRLSVIVPVYNVADYLAPCLSSIAAQTFDDLEVVMVNDGSTDASPEIAASFARRDPRFKLVERPNGGLSAARNTGIDAAADSDFLAFVDSDDVLLPNAYELLVGSLEQTGSQLATGKVLRLTTAGTTRPARFLKKVFRETRLKTHITRFRPLLADRTAWNKVFLRSFWDEQGLRFPEGRINEDIPVILPLHFSARSVDVVAEPVYLWRSRATGELSITERRLETGALLHRIMAVSDVHDFLEEKGLRKAKRWYDEVLVADDLKLYLNVLDRADDEYRRLFLDKVNALLDGADDRIYDDLRAIDRLKWHLVRRRLMPELLEVLRFQYEEMDDRPPLRVDGHWLGDYPFRDDPRLAIPSSVYRVDQEVPPEAHVDDLRVEDGRLRVDGWAYIDGIGAADPGDQRVRLTLLRAGRLERLRHRLTAVRLDVSGVRRADANTRARQRLADVSGSGFTATLDPRKLRRAGRWGTGAWQLYVTIEAGGVRRRTRRMFSADALRPALAVELPGPESVSLRAAPTERREVAVEVATEWAAIASHRVEDGTLVLGGELHAPASGAVKLELREADGTRKRRHPLELAGDGPARAFTARLSLAELARELRSARDEDAEDYEEDPDEVDEEEDEEEPAEDPSWELYVVGAGPRLRVALPATTESPAAWRVGDSELALLRTPGGDAALAVRAPRPLLTGARWGEDGGLALEGELPSDGAAALEGALASDGAAALEGALASDGAAVLEGERASHDAPLASDGAWELVLASAGGTRQHAFAVQPDGGSRFSAVATPAAIPTLGGPLPLPEGRWQLAVRRAGESGPSAIVPIAPADGVAPRLPLTTVVGRKRLALILHRRGDLVLDVSRDLADDERGPYHQRLLREGGYRARREQPLAETVVYDSFRGREYSDNPRAIHEALVRRGAPLEHLWIVRDGACNVPSSARVLREGSREHYEALARTRYYVANDHVPEWFDRRPDQVCVQTWHGTPLRKVGFDAPSPRGRERRLARERRAQTRNWQYVVSPNPHASAVLQRAYQLDAELIEAGYPRTDVLAGPDRDERARRLRERLGIAQDLRVVLYAPSYRDHVRGPRGGYRLDMRLDVERLRDAVGPETVLLFRKHRDVIDDVPARGGDFVRDVSSYPDGTELLLAADVLVTDYSSLMFDFANTGRPMVFFAYDLDVYGGDDAPGLYLDYAATVPGPIVGTTDEVAEALRDLDAVRAAHAERYQAFAREFCALDDGRAADRVADRLFAAA